MLHEFFIGNSEEPIKVIILADGQKITSEVTKKQREILDALNMCA